MQTLSDGGYFRTGKAEIAHINVITEEAEFDERLLSEQLNHLNEELQKAEMAIMNDKKNILVDKIMRPIMVYNPHE